jgi:hypothetical protein
MHRDEPWRARARDGLLPAKRGCHDPRPVGGAVVGLSFGPGPARFRPSGRPGRDGAGAARTRGSGSDAGREPGPEKASGCFRSASSASPVSFCPNSAATCRISRPGADRASGRPAESSGRMPQRSSAAVTRRVRLRSGEISAARVPVSAASRRIRAMRDGLGAFAGGFDQGQGFGGGRKVGQLWPLGQPLVGDRRRTQRERDQPVAIRDRGAGCRSSAGSRPARSPRGPSPGGSGIAGDPRRSARPPCCPRPDRACRNHSPAAPPPRSAAGRWPAPAAPSSRARRWIPARITGAAGGDTAQCSVRRVTPRRSTPSASGASPRSASVTMPRKACVRAQCAEWLATSSAAMRSG